MRRILQPGQAGTIESNDILITVAPAESGSGILIEITSPVIKQYGTVIKALIKKTIKEHGILDAQVHANDKGALDCTIRARVKTAITRAVAEEV